MVADAGAIMDAVSARAIMGAVYARVIMAAVYAGAIMAAIYARAIFGQLSMLGPSWRLPMRYMDIHIWISI